MIKDSTKNFRMKCTAFINRQKDNKSKKTNESRLIEHLSYIYIKMIKWQKPYVFKSFSNVKIVFVYHWKCRPATASSTAEQTVGTTQQQQQIQQKSHLVNTRLHNIWLAIDQCDMYNMINEMNVSILITKTETSFFF